MTFIEKIQIWIDSIGTDEKTEARRNSVLKPQALIILFPVQDFQMFSNGNNSNYNKSLIVFLFCVIIFL